METANSPVKTKASQKASLDSMELTYGLIEYIKAAMGLTLRLVVGLRRKVERKN